MKPQCTDVLNHMEKYGSITSNEAMGMYGITRLASRISDLKQMYGYTIGKTTERGVNRYGAPVNYARYFLTEARQ